MMKDNIWSSEAEASCIASCSLPLCDSNQQRIMCELFLTYFTPSVGLCLILTSQFLIGLWYHIKCVWCDPKGYLKRWECPIAYIHPIVRELEQCETSNKLRTTSISLTYIIYLIFKIIAK